jgi:hypothetical protein
VPGLEIGVPHEVLPYPVEPEQPAEALVQSIAGQEEWEDSPKGYLQTPPYKWWNWHDEYGHTASSQWSSVVDRGLELQGQSSRSTGH